MYIYKNISGSMAKINKNFFLSKPAKKQPVKSKATTYMQKFLLKKKIDDLLKPLSILS